jgi:hypothetical protein
MPFPIPFQAGNLRNRDAISIMSFMRASRSRASAFRTSFWKVSRHSALTSSGVSNSIRRRIGLRAIVRELSAQRIETPEATRLLRQSDLPATTGEVEYSQ